MRIGELINEFDLEENNTLEKFNEVFKTDIKGSPKAKVIIGDITVGGFRELYIDGQLHKVRIKDNHDIKDEKAAKQSASKKGRKLPSMKGRRNKHTHIYTIKKGSDVKSFDYGIDCAKFLGIGQSSLFYRCTLTGGYNSNIYNGWEISRTKVIKENKNV